MVEVSVIVPVYNMAADGKLEYCIRSLVNQTLKDMEVIAVDDASTDDSLEVLKRLEKEFPERLRVIASPENRRQGGARNLGLPEAKGNYIGFMDADDWVTPDLYEKMLTLAQTTGADVVGCDMCRVYEHTMIPTEREACNLMSQVGIMDHEKRKEYLKMPGPVSTKIYERRIFFEPELRFPEKMAYEDNAVTREIAMRIRHYEHIPEALVFYYQHSDSTTHTVTVRQCEDRMKAMRIMVEYAKKNGSLEEFHNEVEYCFTRLFYVTTLLSYMQGMKKKDGSFIRKLGKEMLDTFPDFQDNPYYLEEVSDEEKRLVKLQLKSTFLFILYYQTKTLYRKVIKKLKA